MVYCYICGVLRDELLSYSVEFTKAFMLLYLKTVESISFLVSDTLSHIKNTALCVSVVYGQDRAIGIASEYILVIRNSVCKIASRRTNLKLTKIRVLIAFSYPLIS